MKPPPPPAHRSTLERIVRRDRAIVVAGILAITLLAWWYLLAMGAGMAATNAEAEMHAHMGMSMPDVHAWGGADFLWLLTMWTIMMTAMMLPSAAPVILLVAGTYRRRGAEARGLTAAFAGGYFAAWTGFSAGAAALQLLLHRAALLTDMMASRSSWAAGTLLMAAGVYQWLPIKGACLTHCRSPLAFLTHEWREGAAGAVAMGARHGLYCLGCCWVLMALLFVGGVMNVLWIAALAAFVLVEKLMPVGDRLGRGAGVVFVAWGGWLLMR